MTSLWGLLTEACYYSWVWVFLVLILAVALAVKIAISAKTVGDSKQTLATKGSVKSAIQAKPATFILGQVACR